MLDLEQLQKLTQAGEARLRKEAEEKAKLESEAAAEKVAKEKERFEESIKNSIEYIISGIMLAGQQGKRSYQFECGKGCYDYAKRLCEEFKEIHTKITNLEKWEILNYETGDGKTYYSTAVVFSW